MIKKLTALLLCAVTCFCLCSCGSVIGEDTTTSGLPDVSVTEESTEGLIVITTTEVTTDLTTTEVTTEAITTELTTTETTTEATTEYTTDAVIPPPPVYEGSTPLLYKVTDNKGNYLWLMGTIHVGRQNYYPLPDYVNKAFEESEALAVEVDITKFSKNYLAQMYALKQLTYNDGSTIKDHIPEETYNKAVAILKENGMYSEALEGYKPVMWSNFIDNASISKLGADSSLGVDVHFINRAKETKKPVLQIESSGSQYSMMGDFSEGLQLMILQGSVNSYGKPEKTKADLEEMMDLWYEGDEAEFSAYLKKDNNYDNETVKKLMAEYNKAMFTDRNRKMTDYAVRKLKKGDKVFICVGAAHVIGDDGMVKRLRDLGYKVEAVR